MSLPNEVNPQLLASSAGYTINQSLRFRASASAYLTRTPSVASGQDKWTLSTWVKRGLNGASQQIIGGNTTTSGGTRNALQVEFGSDNAFWVYGFTNASGYYFQRTSTALYRDPSDWYHLVVQFDPDNGTSANKVIAYINGQQVSWGTSSDSGAAGSITSTSYRAVNNTFRNDINGGYQGGGAPIYFGDGYLAEMIMVSGSIVSVDSFGETSASTGVWIPKKYTGTYGTNGFYLPFSNTTSTSTLGNDFSGNGNTWTVNNISLTAGSTYDWMKDSPTLSALGSNYCVMNPLAVTAASSTITNGNLQVVTPSVGGNAFATFQIPATGKWYFEITPTNNAGNGMIGVSAYTVGSTYLWQNTNHVFYYANGQKYVDGTNSAYGASFTDNDVIGVACDSDASTITFYKNNVSQGSISHTMTDMFPALTDGASATGSTFQINFGQRPFSYTPPTGYKELNAFNLPTPTIGATASSRANKYMNVVTYTGTGSSQSITGVGFQPDWTWIKGRSGATDHGLYDAVRGVQKQLESNNTDAETTETTGLTAFGSDGFTVGALAQLNTSSATYVGWNWNAGGSTVTNNSGTISSQVRANQTAGFSIVTYTGNGTNATVGHGLGASPAFIIVKKRSAVDPWVVYHQSFGVQFYALLNASDTIYNNLSNYWGSTAPSSTVFGLGPGYGGNNSNGATYVAYCFAQLDGYSRFGTYIGNGSSDGTFVYTGFKPKFILWKRTDAVDFWTVWNPLADGNAIASSNNFYLLPNSFAAQDTTQIVDTLSNGFKHRDSGSLGNANGGTYLYAAFAETPFKYANAR